MPLVECNNPFPATYCRLRVFTGVEPLWLRNQISELNLSESLNLAKIWLGGRGFNRAGFLPLRLWRSPRHSILEPPLGCTNATTPPLSRPSRLHTLHAYPPLKYFEPIFCVLRCRIHCCITNSQVESLLCVRAPVRISMV